MVEGSAWVCSGEVLAAGQATVGGGPLCCVLSLAVSNL